jgi:uracil-DNA glycosylase family 4
MTSYVPGVGNPRAELMILGESPSYEEVRQGQPFVGPSGKELDRLLRDAGIKRDSCWITNVCKLEVPPSASKTKPIPFAIRAKTAGIDISKQLSDLQNEINNIRPNCILALGGTALWALSGKSKITNFRGSILFGMGRKFVATYHPAHLLHQISGSEIKGYWNRQVMIFDMKRALIQSKFPELNLPRRTLSICQSSAQFASFIERYKEYDRPAIDIEAGGVCIPICIGISFHPREGLVIPLWNRDNISNIPTGDLVQIWMMLAELLNRHDIVGQNFKYDQDKISRLGFSIRNLASDTMLKAFTVNPELPKGLAFNQSIYTEEPFYKDEGMYEGSLNDLFIGCARDACVTKEVDMAMDADLDELGMRPYYENFIMHLHQLYLDIENEGFCEDKTASEELLQKYTEWSEKINYNLFQLCEAYINVNSNPQVSSLLYDNFRLPRRAGTGEEHLTAAIATCKNPLHKKVMELILEGRRVKKTISHYLLALPDFDGKFKTTFFPCLETGRTSTGQQDPPIRPYLSIKTGELRSGRRKKPTEKSFGIAFQTITKHGDIGNDIRKRFVPEKGHVFLQADSSQAEARVVFLLAQDEEALQLIDTNDYHAITATWFFGGIEADHSKKVLGYESPIRFCGKTLRHACHLGASKKAAMMTVNTDARKYKIPISITEMQAHRAIEVFHQKQPKIRNVYHAQVIECLENHKRMLTAVVPYGIDAPHGGRRIFYERWGDELFREAFAYFPQRAVTDNTKAAALRLRKEISGIRIILESHDALLFSIPENRVDDYAPIIKAEMERPIRFDTCSLPRRDLVIPCELEVGYNYMEFTKFKFKEKVA